MDSQERKDGGRPGARPAAIVVMGVAGSGKSVVGAALAQRLGARFIEGDALHPPENVARMAGGQPLTDEHRAGWLDKVAAELEAARSAGEDGVASCSALRRAYRDRLRAVCLGLVFVHLTLDPATARTRVAARPGHFMPASLVDSQFAALQPLAADEPGVEIDARLPVDEVVKQAAAFAGEPRPR